MLAIKITFGDGRTARMFPAPDMRGEGEEDAAFLARIAAKDCPADAQWEIVDEADIPPPPAPVPPSITRRQCAKQMLAMGLISGAEALDMTRSGTPPGMVMDMVGQMPVEEQVPAQIDFAADTYQRSNPLLTSMMQATGASETDIDNFFRAAALL